MRIRLGELRCVVREELARFKNHRPLRETAAGDPRSIVEAAAKSVAEQLGARFRPDAMMRLGSEADATLDGGALDGQVLEMSAKGVDDVELALIDEHGDAERATVDLVDEVDLTERVMDWLGRLGIRP